jgi:hypothetical protein
MSNLAVANKTKNKCKTLIKMLTARITDRLPARKSLKTSRTGNSVARLVATNIILETSKNPKLCVMLCWQNAHLL